MAKVDWAMHIETWQSSGLSQAAYCRLHGLKASYFRKKARADRALPADGRQALIPVRVEPVASSAGSLVLHRGHGQRLEIPASMSPHWVAELLQCLG
jgi:hypothetical protein